MGDDQAVTAMATATSDGDAPARIVTGSGAPSLFRAGDCIAGRYEVIAFVARGGMGEVYEVADTELGGRVALKTIARERTGDERAEALLRREVAVARGITHANVCRVFDVGIHAFAAGGETSFVTMELVRGESLAARIERGPLAIPEALALLEQIAGALDAIHGAGVVHRDLKAHNVLLEAAGGAGTPRAVVTDFGLSRRDGHASTTEVAGTPAYMAPELFAGGGRIAPAIDVYALGVVAFELVAGRRPFEDGPNPFADALRRVHEDAPRLDGVVPDAPAAWVHTLAACLSRDPRDRPASPGAVIAMLRGEVKPPRRRRWVTAAIGAGAFACIAAAAFALLRTPAETWPAPLRDIDAEHRLALTVGSPGRDTLHGVVAIGDDRVIAGYVAGPAGLPGGRLDVRTVARERQGFVARVGIAGELRWRTPIEGIGGARVVGLAARGDQLVVVGAYFGPVTVAGVPLAVPRGVIDCYVAALDAATGAVRWFVPCGASDEGHARAVAVDDDGTIYVAGDFSASAAFGGATVHVAATNPHARSPFVASYTPSGELRWVLAGAGATNARAHALAARGGVVIAGGQVQGRAKIADHAIDAPPTGTCFVARLDPASGAVRWLRQLNAAALCGTNAAAIGDGWIVAGGDYTGPGLGGDGLPELASDAPRRDGWVGSFEPDTGVLRWLRRIGTAGHDRVKDIAILGDRAVVVGDLFLTLVVDDVVLRSAGTIDIYELHFDRTGRARAGRTLGGTGEETVRRVVLGDDGTVRIVGHFNAALPLGPAALVSSGDHDGFLVEKSPLR